MIDHIYLTVLKFRMNWCVVILWVSLASCVDQIELALENKDQNLAINGFITNLPEPYFVFVRNAGNYGASIQEETPIAGAFVQIISSSGDRVNLEETGNGVYQSNPATFVGRIGNSYLLNVILPDGRQYVSESEELLPVPPISDLRYNFYEDPYLTAEDDIAIQKKIDILVTTRVPGDPDNVFFKWDVRGEYEFRENEALTDIFAYTGVGPVLYTCFIPDNIRLGDIAVFNGNQIRGTVLKEETIKTINVDYKFAFNYCVHVRQFSLTKNAFTYWNRVAKTLNRNGQLLEESIGTLKGNISNLDVPSESVAGYFYASASTEKRMFVPRDSVGRPVSSCILVDPAFAEACMDCLIIENSTRERPAYWPF